MSVGMRIGMVTTFYPPYHFGGDAIAVQRLSRALVRLGHDVTVVHDADAYRALGGRVEDHGTRPDDDGVRVVTLTSRVAHLSALLTQQLGRPIVHASQLRRLLNDGRFDIVNFHNVSLIGGPGILGWGGQAVRLYTAHEHWLVCPTHVLWRHGRELCDARECIQCELRHGRPPQLWRRLGAMERGLRHVDAFMAMSEFSRQKHREFGFPYDMEVLPAFLPARDAGAPPTSRPPALVRPYFLFVGRLERIKGLDDVIPMFARAGSADLVVIGEGAHRAALEALAAGNPRVRFLGRLPNESLGPFYEHAVAVVAPSVCYETFGLSLVEAFRYGTPVIARRIGPFPELVNASGAGIMFSTPDELASALDQFATDPDLRQRLADAALEAFDAHWTEQVVVPRYLEIAHRAAKRRGAVDRLP